MKQHYSWSEIRLATKSANALERTFTAISEPPSYFILNYTSLSPNAVTVLGSLCGLAGAYLQFEGHRLAAFAGFCVFLILDCCDGTMARATGRVSAIGAKLDLYSDRTVLFVTVLLRIAEHARRDALADTCLCTAYLISHYYSDLRWLGQQAVEAARPPQWRDLKHQLLRQAAVSHKGPVPPWRKLFRRISRWEYHLEPTAWVCNIFFLTGACLAPGDPATLYVVVILALQWPLAALLFRRGIKMALRRAP